MRQQIRTLSMTLAGTMWCALVAGAAQEPYDIDLKELRSRPARHAKKLRSTQEPAKSDATPPVASGDNSIYTVQPRDHLFLILMRHYELSNAAAERLIPEIMRQNGIRTPKGLTVGQRLMIPLPPPTEKRLESSRRKSLRSSKPESADNHPRTVDTTIVREVAAPSSAPCPLAREVADQLGIRVSSFSPLLDAESLSVSHDVLKLAVVCGRAPAETYTLDRLLARQGVKLLTFKADEAPRTVIEGLAGRLGISFLLSNSDTAAERPLTYLFPGAIAGKDLMLTIRPDIPASKLP